MINTDNFHAKGKQHIFCQDYSMSGLEPVPYAIVADGCSSSENSDVGAMILARSAYTLLCKIIKDTSQYIFNADVFGFYTIIHAESTIKELNLNKECLDASLIISFYYNTMFYIFSYGDGVFCIKEKESNKWRINIINYKDEMPYYLTYLIDGERREVYKKFVWRNGAIHANGFKTIKYPDVFYDTYCDYSQPIKRCFSKNVVSDILISSDGLSTFRNKLTNEQKDISKVLTDFTNFKALKGEVMKRTAKKVLKKYADENIYNYDDISFGVLLTDVVNDKENTNELVKWI